MGKRREFRYVCMYLSHSLPEVARATGSVLLESHNVLYVRNSECMLERIYIYLEKEVRDALIIPGIGTN